MLEGFSSSLGTPPAAFSANSLSSSTADNRLLAIKNQATNLKAAPGSRLDDNTKAQLRSAAEEFEAIFISQMLGPIFDSVETDDLFGGGSAEGIYKSMFVDEVGKSAAKNGGLGIADRVYADLIRLQEAQ